MTAHAVFNLFSLWRIFNPLIPWRMPASHTHAEDTHLLYKHVHGKCGCQGFLRLDWPRSNMPHSPQTHTHTIIYICAFTWLFNARNNRGWPVSHNMGFCSSRDWWKRAFFPITIKRNLSSKYIASRSVKSGREIVWYNWIRIEIWRCFRATLRKKTRFKNSEVLNLRE